MDHLEELGLIDHFGEQDAKVAALPHLQTGDSYLSVTWSLVLAAESLGASNADYLTVRRYLSGAP